MINIKNLKQLLDCVNKELDDEYKFQQSIIKKENHINQIVSELSLNGKNMYSILEEIIKHEPLKGEVSSYIPSELWLKIHQILDNKIEDERHGE